MYLFCAVNKIEGIVCLPLYLNRNLLHLSVHLKPNSSLTRLTKKKLPFQSLRYPLRFFLFVLFHPRYGIRHRLLLNWRATPRFQIIVLMNYLIHASIHLKTVERSGKCQNTIPVVVQNIVQPVLRIWQKVKCPEHVL